jgi:hypothetical protein
MIIGKQFFGQGVSLFSEEWRAIKIELFTVLE